MRLVDRMSVRIAAVAMACGAMAAGAIALTGTAGASPTSSGQNSASQNSAGQNSASPGSASQSTGGATQDNTAETGYSFTTLDNPSDPTFNQLLGINDGGVIAGYFGSGAAGHPNQGYLLNPPYGTASYSGENFPGSVQTQVTGLNDDGNTVGFFANAAGANFGFYTSGTGFHEVNFPDVPNASPQVDQLLGINDAGVAVGFYTNSAGNVRGFTYNIHTQVFHHVLVPGEKFDPWTPSLTAAGINSRGDVTGFYTTSSGATDGFLKIQGGGFTDLAVPGASSTMALGVNDRDEVVGTYTVGSGSSAPMHGFTWTPGGGFVTVDDPQGVGTTTINGLNDRGDLVGFYVDSQGNTDGFLAKPSAPARTQTISLNLHAMPEGTVTLGRGTGGSTTATVTAYGLTPGSSHAVELVGGNGMIAQFDPLTAGSNGQVSATLSSSSETGPMSGGRLEILNGTGTDPVSTEPIAETPRIFPGQSSYPLVSVEVGQAGANFGTPQGHATLVYNPSAQTISVTVTASGLTPGPHAAHIHTGSCMDQGPVQYMLIDFTANSAGQIVNQTRTVTGVTGPIPASGWYLNLHQGDSNTILSDGQPTIYFRPLLCANI